MGNSTSFNFRLLPAARIGQVASSELSQLAHLIFASGPEVRGHLTPTSVSSVLLQASQRGGTPPQPVALTTLHHWSDDAKRPCG